MYLWNEYNDGYELVAKIGLDKIEDFMPKTHTLIQILYSQLASSESTTFISYGLDEIKKLTDNLVVNDSVIITPLTKENKLIGFVILYNNKEKIQYRTSVIDLMNSIAYQVIETIDNIKKKEDELMRERLERSRKGSIIW